MSDALKAKIAEHRALLASLDEKRVVVAAELGAYEDALRLVSTPTTTARAVASFPPLKMQATVTAVPSKSAKWPLLLQELAKRHPETFDIDDIQKAAERVSLHPTRGNIRSQMAAFVNKKILQRLGHGMFKFTDEGAAQFRAPENASRVFALDATASDSAKTDMRDDGDSASASVSGGGAGTQETKPASPVEGDAGS